jgi:hypothetical protein
LPLHSKTNRRKKGCFFSNRKIKEERKKEESEEEKLVAVCSAAGQWDDEGNLLQELYKVLWRAMRVKNKATAVGKQETIILSQRSRKRRRRR